MDQMAHSDRCSIWGMHCRDQDWGGTVTGDVHQRYLGEVFMNEGKGCTVTGAVQELSDQREVIHGSGHTVIGAVQQTHMGKVLHGSGRRSHSDRCSAVG